jgi:acetyl esterase/lipase
MRQILILFFIIASIPAISAEETTDIMTSEDLASFVNPPPNVRIPYGEGSLQFADLRLPDGVGPHPVMILIHGGCWLSMFDIAHVGKLADALARSGIATWTVEYRRVGDEGGGWPGTFQDIAKSSDHLLSVANEYSLDTNRIIVAGHSAGGHLALWLAARKKFSNNALFSSPNQVQLKGVLALAPAPDLALLHKKGVCENVIDKLMGGSPADFPDRYAMASPPELVPFGIPQVVLVGHHDKNWRDGGLRYYELAKSANEDIRFIDAAESGHFEMIDPDSSTWSLVQDAAYALLGMTGNGDQ